MEELLMETFQTKFDTSQQELQNMKSASLSNIKRKMTIATDQVLMIRMKSKPSQNLEKKFSSIS